MGITSAGWKSRASTSDVGPTGEGLHCRFYQGTNSLTLLNRVLCNKAMDTSLRFQKLIIEFNNRFYLMMNFPLYSIETVP